jgi:predicted O-linked N-acetylglucosamine transferase (SPINDLY family)
VAADAADYVRIAAGLAGDLTALAGLRATLRPRMASSPLCDGARFAQDFAAMLRRIAV